MKALDKAAKDREDADAGRASAAPAAATQTPGAGAAKSELLLEPIAQRQATAQAAAPREPSPSPGKPAGAAPATASRESDQAAIMIRASQRDTGGGVGAYVREHPLLVFGTLPALFLIGFGSYVYLQMTKPGLVVKQPPRPAQSAPSAPIVPAPATTEIPMISETVAPPSRRLKMSRPWWSVPRM